MEKKIALVGVGNCGGQVANKASTEYPEIFDSVFINSSESDLSMVGESNLKFKIGDKDEIEGSGKNRAKMKQYLKSDIMKILRNEDLQECLSTKKYVFIITSAAGGTGSGAAPILMDLLSQLFPDSHFILVAVLPQLTASKMEQGNALEFLDEMYTTLGDNITYMIYDNETRSELPPTKALEAVNKEIVEDLRILSGIDCYPSPYETIDEADLESIITTPGRLLISRITSNITEKSMEDNNLDEIIIKSIKRSAHAETDRNKRVLRWGIITYFTNEVNALYRPTLDALVNFLGTPIERFNHNAINNKSEQFNFLYLVASGLSPINDRVKKITDKIEEYNSLLASDNTNKYILAGEGESYSTAEERKKADKKNRSSAEFDVNDIFKKFM